MKKAIYTFTELAGASYDLSVIAVEDAQYHYRKIFEVYPTTLFVALNLVDEAYRVMMEVGVQRMIVVPIPGLPSDMWGLCGVDAAIICEGA
jgi:hypothetical protein